MNLAGLDPVIIAPALAAGALRTVSDWCLYSPLEAELNVQSCGN
jgi:hypothetical protein